MAQTLAGMLTGISPQGISPTGNYEQQAMALGANASNMMQGGLQGLTGRPDKSLELRKALSALDINKTEDLKKLIQISQATGDIKTATALAAKLQEKTLLATQREGLIKQAKDLGLDQTAEVLIAGGDMEAGTKQVLEQEERNVIAKQGRKGKLAVAESKNAGQAVYDSIKSGKYDKMSDTLFLETMRGEKAVLKPYKRIVNGKETIGPYRINEAGKAYDEENNQWVNPSELGLLAAPQLSKVLSAGDEVTSKLTGGFVDKYLELNVLGLEGAKMLDINAASSTNLDKLYTGKLAPIQLEIMALGKKLGVISPEQEDSVVATQTFMINRAKQVLPLIKALGSGTAISDKDREFISKIVAADEAGISLSLESIKNIIRIEEEYARKAINASNTALEQLGRIKGANLDPALVEGLYITAPQSKDVSDEGYNSSVQAIIDRVRERNSRLGTL
tara:strand:- start:1779 stop:3125 length:1347 start_codon:yes stop_codon:yes gene_type:complete